MDKTVDKHSISKAEAVELMNKKGYITVITDSILRVNADVSEFNQIKSDLQSIGYSGSFGVKKEQKATNINLV